MFDSLPLKKVFLSNTILNPMKHIIEEGHYKRSKFIFLGTGFFLVALFGYQLYNFLQTNEFQYQFPGDWDYVIGIAVGIFLIIRSRKFIVGSRDLFVEISESQLTYRTERSKSVENISFSNIKNLQKKDGKIILITNSLTELIIVDFNKARIRDDKRKSITKSILELNHDNS